MVDALGAGIQEVRIPGLAEVLYGVDGDVLHLDDILFEKVLVLLPGNGPEPVGAAELPKDAVRDILFLAAIVKGVRKRLATAEDGDAGALPGVVHPVPENPAHFVGHPAAELDHGGIGAPAHGHGPDKVDGAGGDGVQGRAGLGGEPGVREGAHDGVSLGNRLPVLRHVILRPLVGAAEDLIDVPEAQLLLGLDAEGNGIIFHGQPQGRGEVIENEPVADGEVLSFGPGDIIGLEPDEVALTVPEAVLLRNGLHVVGGHEMVLVPAVDPADAGNVAGYGNLVVRDALGHPYCADPVPSATHDLKGPYFLLVRHGEAFSGVPVAVFLGRGTHEPDGVAGVVAAHEGKAGEFLDEEGGVLVDEGVRSGEGGFTHGELLFIQAGIAGIDVSVCVPGAEGNLGDLTESGGVTLEPGVAGAFVHLEYGVLLVVLRGLHGNPGVGHAVTGVRCIDGSVVRCQASHHDTGAAFGLVTVGIDALGSAGGRHRENGEQTENQVFHAICISRNGIFPAGRLSFRRPGG